MVRSGVLPTIIARTPGDVGPSCSRELLRKFWKVYIVRLSIQTTYMYTYVCRCACWSTTGSNQHVCRYLSSENITLTRGDIEMDFLFGKERSDGDPWPCDEWLSFTLFPLAKIPASVLLLRRFLTARRSGPDPEACRDWACIIVQV